jgi:F0F1-type ATP synthase assembly protein I
MSEHKPLEKEAVAPLVIGAGALLWKGLMLALAAYSADRAGARFGEAAGSFDADRTGEGWRNVGLGAVESLGMLPGIGTAAKGVAGASAAADTKVLQLARAMLSSPEGVKILERLAPKLLKGTQMSGLQSLGTSLGRKAVVFGLPPVQTFGDSILTGLQNRFNRAAIRKEHAFDRTNLALQGGVPFAPAVDIRKAFGEAPTFTGSGTYVPQEIPPGKTNMGNTRLTPIIDKIERFLIRSHVAPGPVGLGSAFDNKLTVPGVDDVRKLFAKPPAVQRTYSGIKTSQDYSMLNYQPGLRNRTLEDLYAAIRSDMTLDPATKAQLVGQVRGLTGMASSSTPLSALMMKGLGGALGYLLSKYFGLSPMGQLVSTVAGYGLGSALNNYLNKPPDPYPGYRMLV